MTDLITVELRNIQNKWLWVGMIFTAGWNRCGYLF